MSCSAVLDDGQLLMMRAEATYSLIQQGLSPGLFTSIPPGTGSGAGHGHRRGKALVLDRHFRRSRARGSGLTRRERNERCRA